MEDDQEIGAYMFRRTVPSMHLTPEDVRWMVCFFKITLNIFIYKFFSLSIFCLFFLKVGAWRDRIIICTCLYGPSPALIKAFLDSGAKAVICPSSEPQEMQLTTFNGSTEFNDLENGKFEIGVDEGDDEYTEPISPASDWEDSETDKGTTTGTEKGMLVWDDDEEELTRFVCRLYDSIFMGGVRVNVALQQALTSHRTTRYSCHFPRVP